MSLKCWRSSTIWGLTAIKASEAIPEIGKYLK